MRERRSKAIRTPFVDGFPTRFGFLMPDARKINSVSLSRRGFGGFGSGSCGVRFVRRSRRPSRRLPVRPPSIDVKHFNRPFRSPSIALDALAAPSRVVDVSPKSPSRASSRVLATAPLSRVVRTVAVVLVRLVVRGVVGRLRHRSTLARLRCALDKDGSRVSMRARRPDGMGRENPNDHRL